MTSTKKGVGGQQKLTRGDFKERKTGKLSETTVDKGGGSKFAQKKMTSFVNAPL